MEGNQFQHAVLSQRSFEASDSRLRATETIPLASLQLNSTAFQFQPRNHTPRDIWKSAFDKLSTEDQETFQNGKQQSRNLLIDDVLQKVASQKQAYLDKRLKFVRNGKAIYIRDLCDRIITWVNKFKEVGDIAMQYDASHAALPWAACRLLLEIAVRSSQIFPAIAEGVETVTRLLKDYQHFEGAYFLADRIMNPKLLDCSVDLYASILAYLAYACRFYKRTSASRIWPSLKYSMDEQSVKRLRNIKEAEQRLKNVRDMTGFQVHTEMLTEIANILSPQETRTEEKHQKLLRWLDCIPTVNEFHRAREARLKGTCSWILEHPLLKEWLIPSGSETKMLWIRGRPGCGKTVIAATIVEHLHAEKENLQSPEICFFFCSFDDEEKRKPESIIRSWVGQLIDKHAPAWNNVATRYQGNEMRQATDTEVWGVFEVIVQDMPGCFFVVDGLDECAGHDERHGKFLKRLWESSKSSKSRILILSRDNHTLRLNVEPDYTESCRLLQYDIQPSDTSADLSIYANSVIMKRLQKNHKADFIHETTKSATVRAEGIFLWIRLLDTRLDPGAPKKQLTKLVSESPVELGSLFERELQQIYTLQNEDRTRAVAILRWVLFATRPLTVRELAEAFTTAGDNPPSQFPTDDLPEHWNELFVNFFIRRCCFSLVEIRPCGTDESFEKHTVHMVHSSVKEFLCARLADSIRTATIMFPDGELEHLRLTKACLAYICYDDMMANITRTEDLRTHMDQFQFLQYAARWWPLHGSYSQKHVASIRVDLEKLFDPISCRWVLWSKVFEKYEEEFDVFTGSDNQNPPNPLYYASLLGLQEIVTWLFSKGVNANSPGGRYGNALQAAAARGHSGIVQILLSNGAEVNLIGGRYGSALIAIIAKGGSNSLMELLIDGGADITISDPDGNTALHHATKNDLLSAVQRLLSLGADVTKPNKDGATPLHLATATGNLEIIRRLIDRSANIDAQDSHGRTPLMRASAHGVFEIVEYLVQCRADLTILDNEKQTVLHFAASGRHLDIFRLLLDRGVDPNPKPLTEPSLLLTATINGHLEIVELLLEYKADPNIPYTMNYSKTHVPDDDGNLFPPPEGDEDVLLVIELEEHWPHDDTMQAFPLDVAAYNGFELVTKVLLQHGAHVHAQAAGHPSTLELAAHSGNTTILELLLQHVETAKGISSYDLGPALRSAVRANRMNFVKQLLQKGVNINQANHDGYTPLFIACDRNHTEIVQLLLNHNAQIEPTQGLLPSALAAASSQGHFSLVQTLIQDHNANVNYEDKDSRTPLLVAIGTGHQKCVELLIKHNVHVNHICRDGQHSLFVASYTGNLEIMKLLLHSQADVSLVDGSGNTALHAAAFKCNIAATELLLSHGANVDAQNKEGSSALHVTAQNGLHDIAAILIQRHGNVTILDDEKRSPLSIASYWGHFSVAKLLIEHYEDKASLMHDWTPIHAASERGHLDIVRLLLQHGADVDLTDQMGVSALHLSARNGHFHIFQELLKHNADISVVDKLGRNLIHVAAFGGDLEMVRYLLASGIDTCTLTGNGKTALHYAALGGHLSVTQLLLDHGTNPNIVDVSKLTPLHIAAAEGHLSLVRCFFDSGVDIHVDQGNGTPLHWAAAKGSWDIADFLIERNADVNAISQRITPLILASENGHNDIVHLLLKTGSDVNYSEPKTQHTSLARAMSGGHLTVAETLILNGADVNVFDIEGNTPLHVLKADSYNEGILSMILSKFVDINVTNQSGGTVLHLAAWKGNVALSQALLKSNIEINAQDQYGYTALHLASIKGHDKIVELLLEFNANPTISTAGGSTALGLASCNGRDTVVNLLFPRMLRPDSPVPIWFLAVNCGYDNIVRTLLDIEGRLEDHFGSALHTAAPRAKLELMKLLFERRVNIGRDDLQFLQVAYAGDEPQLLALLSQGTSPNTTFIGGLTAGFAASLSGRVAQVGLLLKYGMNVNMVENAIKWTVLHCAVMAGNPDLVQLLINHAANGNLRDSHGNTPLHYAAMLGNEAIGQILLRSSVKNNVQNALGQTPLYISVAKGFKTFVTLLLDFGADPNIPDDLGQTCLFEAVSSENASIISLLVANGADVCKKDIKWETALHASARRGDTTSSRLLLKAGVNINGQSDGGRTALMYAAYHEHTKVVKLLVDEGADIDIRDEHGFSAIDIALQRNEGDMVEIFMAAGQSLTEHMHFDRPLRFKDEDAHGGEEKKPLIGQITYIGLGLTRPSVISSVTNE